MINWRKPDQFPDNGQQIFVLCMHWKERFPCSYEIYGCEFVRGMQGVYCTTTNDDSGKGSWGPYWPGGSFKSDDEVVGWVPAEEIGPLK